MSCLWQSSKIPGLSQRKDIMMVLRYLQTKIRYRFSSPYVCVAVTEQRCSDDLQVLACFNLIYIKLSLQICYVLLYCICLILRLRLYHFLSTVHIFPTTQEGLTQRYHIFINNLCFQIINFWTVFFVKFGYDSN